MWSWGFEGVGSGAWGLGLRGYDLGFRVSVELV